MQNKICINNSDSSILVYGYNDIVGELYPREAFCWTGGEGSVNGINFLDPNGNYIDGTIYTESFCDITDYPYGEVKFDTYNYALYTFIMQRTMNIYNANGDYWGRVAAGCLVACETAMAGDNMTYLKGINWVQNTSGEWIQVITDDNRQYGYVDTGLRSGSSPSSIALYGCW